MLRSLGLSCIIVAALSACAPDYTPTSKSMVSTQEKVFQYGLVDPNSEIEPYAWEDLEYGLKSIPLKHIKEAEIITNRSAFLKTNGYEKLALALWEKGLPREKLFYTTFHDESEPAVQVVVRYKGISYPKGCPDWRHSASRNHDNSTFSNFGCANAINLGHMLDNQKDLIESRGDHRPQAESSIEAVSRYHRGEFIQQAAENSENATAQ